MPLSRLTCPICLAELKPKTPVPEGTRVRCPKCKGAFVAGGEPPAEEPEPEPVQEPMPDAAARPAEEEIAEAEEAPPPPRRTRRSRDDEEGEERPRRKPAKKGGVPVWAWFAFGGGGVLLLCCCPVSLVGGYFAINGVPGLAGLNVNQAHLDQIKKDMTEAQVKQIMGGEPNEITPVENGMKYETWKSGPDFITIGFKSGKADHKSFHLTLGGGAEMSGTMPLP
jgi:hypothetical protein